MSQSQTEYNKRYYERNKKIINKRRKELYHSDPEYRQAVIEREREAYQKRRELEGEVDRQRLVTETGDTYYSIGKVAKLVGASRSTIRGLHKDDVIPPPSQFDQRGWRLYTARQVVLLRDVLGSIAQNLISSGWNRRGKYSYPIGEVKDATGVSILTLRSLHYDGLIPAPAHVDERGWRRYTRHQINLLESTLGTLRPSLIGGGWFE